MEEMFAEEARAGATPAGSTSPAAQTRDPAAREALERQAVPNPWFLTASPAILVGTAGTSSMRGVTICLKTCSLNSSSLEL